MIADSPGLVPACLIFRSITGLGATDSPGGATTCTATLVADPAFIDTNVLRLLMAGKAGRASLFFPYGRHTSSQAPGRFGAAHAYRGRAIGRA